MHKNIGYHTRLHGDHTVKVVGGTFSGTFSAETVDHLVNNHFEVYIYPSSGNPVFVDKEGRKVSLYISVDPLSTEKGKAALAEHNKMKLAEAKQEREEDDEIERLLAGMSNEEALRRLRMRS